MTKQTSIQNLLELSIGYSNYQAKDMPISEILESMSGNTGLTEEKIYQNIMVNGKRYTVLSASTDEKTGLGQIPMCYIDGKKLKVFEDKVGILISRVGVGSGTSTFLPEGKYTITENAYILYLKESLHYEINLRWLMYQYRKRFFEFRSVSDYGVWNKSLFFNNFFIDIPSIAEQNTIVGIYDDLQNLKNKIIYFAKQIDKIKEQKHTSNYSDYQAKDVPISEILKSMSGNTGLTEETIYQKIAITGKRYTVLSASTDEETGLGQIPMCYIDGKKLKVFEDKEGILVIRKGKAGTTFHLSKGQYTITDDAYVLYQKNFIEYEIDLKWLMYELQNIFLDYSSKADNGTWNKTGFFNNVTIDIPVIEEQNSIIPVYDKVEKLLKNIANMRKKIEELL